jgi:hypothetical protein
MSSAKVGLALLVAITFSLDWVVVAQEIPSKTATVGPPKEAGVTRALTPAELFLRRRQTELNEHHLPIPTRPRTEGTRSFVPGRKGSETPVFTTISGEGVRINFDHPFARIENDFSTAPVSEPTLAIRGNYILVTANWFASLSRDGGKTFQHVRPWDVFPETTSNPFCCDQVAIYDQRNDVIIWLLQYGFNDDGNMLRVAVAQGSDIDNQHWRYYDLDPKSIGSWTNQWFDFPNLTVSAQYLYVSANVYSTRDDTNPDGSIKVKTPFKRSVMMRIPLAALASYKGFTLNYFDTPEFGGLRATQGALTTMYFGADADSGKLRIFSWPENSNNLKVADVVVQDWDQGKAVARCPDQNDWMDRTDTRITAAWADQGTIGFAWTAPQDGFFRFPQVRMAILKADTLSVIAEPIIWNNEFAFALPSIATSPSGDLGISFHYGGNFHFPSHAVGVLHPIDRWHSSNWNLHVVAGTRGLHAPLTGGWGDYGAVRTLTNDPETWATVGYTLQGTQSEVQLDYVEFKKTLSLGGAP